MTPIRFPKTAKCITGRKTNLLYIAAVKPALTGKDLKAIGYGPGPLFNKIFKAILDARLEGRIKSIEEEIHFVKEHFSV